MGDPHLKEKDFANFRDNHFHTHALRVARLEGGQVVILGVVLAILGIVLTVLFRG